MDITLCQSTVTTVRRMVLRGQDPEVHSGVHHYYEQRVQYLDAVEHTTSGKQPVNLIMICNWLDRKQHSNH